MRIRFEPLRRASLFPLSGLLLLAVMCHQPSTQSQQLSLRNFELACRDATNSAQKKEIALEAVDFLLQQTPPDSSIIQLVDSAVANEALNFSTSQRLFPKILAIANDSLAGAGDSLLTQKLPQLYWLQRHQPDSVHDSDVEAAKKMAAQVDHFLQYPYWLPLMETLNKANETTWRCWRKAAAAANISRQYTNASNFAQAQVAAIYGLQASQNCADQRQKLDLYFRLQNPLVEGDSSLFNLGLALAEWIHDESKRIRYFLRMAGIEFNSGNQLVLLGRYDEALEKLKNVLQYIQQWRHFRSLWYYSMEVKERIAVASWELGDYKTMVEYLNHYGRHAQGIQQRTLYHFDLGLAAQLIGDFQTAEREFENAIAYGRGIRHNNEAENPNAIIATNPLNVWYAYLRLGDLYLEYDLPDNAITHFHTAKAYADSTGILSVERLSEYWLYLARAYVQKDDMPLAKITLLDAEQKFSDSPVLRVNGLLQAAGIHESLGELPRAEELLKQARMLCHNYRMSLYEIDAILRQTALSFKMPANSHRVSDPAAELEEMIERINAAGGRQQLVRSLALVIEKAGRAKNFDEAQRYATWLQHEVEVLSERYTQEKRLIFFQHSIYKDIKAAINLEIRQSKLDAAFATLDYAKSRALRQRRDRRSEVRNADTGLAGLRKQLHPNEAVFDYMVAADTLFIIVSTATRSQIFHAAISRRDLQNLVQQYLAELTPNASAGAPRKYNEQSLEKDYMRAVQLSCELYHQLIEPASRALEKINRLYIVPDEFLFLLPFNTLACQDNGKIEFLVERYALMYLPAASLFAEDRKLNRRYSSPPNLLASVDSALYFESMQIRTRLDSLQKIKALVKTHWRNQTELEAQLKKQLQAYFFYAHAEASWNDPWQSYIQFPLQDVPFHGKLTYNDIDSINWTNTELVMLIGCETAGNRFYGGAGLSGLQRSFLSGGVAQVLATFWKIDAGQITPQVLNFIDAWHESGDAVSALQEMQIKAIADLKSDDYLKYPHPRHWGAYSLAGTTANAGVPFYASTSGRGK